MTLCIAVGYFFFALYGFYEFKIISLLTFFYFKEHYLIFQDLI